MGAEEDSLPLPARADLLLYAPCPVKLVIKDHIDRIVEQCRKSNVDFFVHLPMGCTSVAPFDPIYREKDPDKLPSIIASIGFGDFWKKEFVERFVRSGLFESMLPAAVNSMHVQAGMIDPGLNYTVYGVTPYIFLVDTRRLGSLPVPRSWEELLEPMYRNEIVMCGDGDDMADAVVLNLYKEKGIEGLRRLAHNVKSIMHSSQMAKITDRRTRTLRPYSSFHCFLPRARGDTIMFGWSGPKDGAAASPLYFLAKRKEKERLSELLSFFTTGFASIKSASWFVPIGQTDLTGFPEGAKLKWIGWDYIERNDINTLRDELNLSFRAARKGLR